MLCAWLVNTLVCFHSNTPFERKSHFYQLTGSSGFAGHNLVLLVAGHFGKHHPDKKITYQYRYLGSNALSFLPVWPNASTAVNTGSLYAAANPLKHYLNPKLLPAHYLFLFRLTPF